MSLQLVGSYVAIVTPFRPDGAVDYAKLEELVEFHIANGTDGVVPVGTTGESPTLTHEEHKEVISVVVKKVNKRIKGNESDSNPILILILDCSYRWDRLQLNCQDN